MNYLTVIKKLYGDDEDELLNVLNSAIYVEDYNFDKKTLLIHTGFIFMTHKQKKMTLIYDLVNKAVIKQVHFESSILLPFNGVLFFQASDGFLYNSNRAYLMVEICDNNEQFEIYELDNSVYNVEKCNPKNLIVKNEKLGKNTVINSILVKYDSKSNETFPLQKNSDIIFYFDGSSFDIYTEDINENDEIIEDRSYTRNRIRNTYKQYTGSWAQEIEELSDDFINNVLDGEPDAYWNID